VLVLVRADGAAWVQAALVRDLVCRSSCPTCSYVSYWAALICSACASIELGPPWFFFSLPGGLTSPLPAPVAQPVPLLLAVAWLGRLPAAASFAAEVLLSAQLLLCSVVAVEKAACVPLKNPL